MISTRFLQLLIYGMAFLSIVEGMPAYATASPLENLEGHPILAPVVQRAQALGIPITAEDQSHLKNVTHHLQAILPVPSLHCMMTLVSQYLQNMEISFGPGEEDHRPPSLREATQLLEKLGEIESHYLHQPIAATPFLCELLESYFYAEPVAQHFYYLDLFHALLRGAQMDQHRTELIVYWAQGFMRAGHTENDCTNIATRVAAYMRDHPDETYEEGPLQDAVDDRQAWADHEVVSQLDRYLTDVYTSSSDEDSEDHSGEPDGARAKSESGMLNR